MTQQDKKQPVTQRPNTGNSNSPVDLEDISQQVPEVDDLISEIDKLLKKTEPREVRGCGCRG